MRIRIGERDHKGSGSGWFKEVTGQGHLGGSVS